MGAGQVLRDEERDFGANRFRLTVRLTDEAPPRDHVSAAHCLAFAGDRIVLARHVTRDWTIPGGHVEPGESVEEAMRREALEEAGAVVGRASLLAVERIERLSGPRSERYPEPAFQVFFVAPVVGTLVAPTALEECTESRLFAPDDARVAPGWVQDLPALYEAALAWARDHLCGGCEFVYDEADHPGATEAIRAGVAAFAQLLRSSPPAMLAVRPAPSVWSPVEYACHLRDVLLVQRERAIRALVAPRPDGEPPRSPPMYGNDRVEVEGYDSTAAEDAARQLVDAADLFTNVLDRLDGDGWSRTLVYNYPVERERTLRWLAVHTLHEVVHHLGDASVA